MPRFVADGRGRDALRPGGRPDVPPLLRGDGACMETADGADAQTGTYTERTRRALRTTTDRFHSVAKKERKTVVIDLEALTYETGIAGKKFL